MNIFIIGGDGFLGSHISRKFVKEGHRVTVFGPGLQENLIADIGGEIDKVEGDISDSPSLFRGLLGSKADVVIHLAAFGAGKDGLAKSAQHSPKKALDINIMGFYNVMEAARSTGVFRIIWSGSSTVFGPASWYQEERIKESAAIHPSTFYGCTKVMNELMARFYRDQHQMDITCLRLPIIYGPGKWYKGAAASIVDMFEQCTSDHEVVIKGGDESIDLMYVTDMADVFYHTMMTEHPLSDIYHVKSHTTTLQELVDTIKTIIPGYKLRFQQEASTLVYPLMDTSKIERDLHYSPCYSVLGASRDYLKEVRRNSK